MVKFNKIFVFGSIFLFIGVVSVLSIYAQEDKEVGSKWKYYKTPELSGTEITNLALQAARQSQQYIADTNKRINAFSRKLEDYISLWLKGKAKAKFPKGFFSEWIDNEKTHDWRLVKPDEINPDEQWHILSAYDPAKELYQFSPDPSGTYLRIIFIAPLNSKLLIEGDFPHCRFMDYQIILPLDPLHPQEAMCEVPLVDVDIEPDPGHINSFRVAADRNAQRRH